MQSVYTIHPLKNFGVLQLGQPTSSYEVTSRNVFLAMGIWKRSHQSYTQQLKKRFLTPSSQPDSNGIMNEQQHNDHERTATQRGIFWCILLPSIHHGQERKDKLAQGEHKSQPYTLQFRLLEFIPTWQRGQFSTRSLEFFQQGVKRSAG